MMHAPVFYTLAQVNFNPILQMGEFVPKIQDRLRRDGFPDFRKEQLRQVAFKQTDGEAPEISTHDGPTRWNFIDASRQSGYLLLPNSLVYHTTAYATFDDFAQKLLDGLRLIHEEVGLAYVERIGLRYLDAVVPKVGETLVEYLNNSVTGLSIALQGKLQHTFTETAIDTSEGKLVSRVLITEGELAVAPDLFPLPLVLEKKFAELNGIHAVLDNDYFTAARFEFNPERVTTLLNSFHNSINAAFKASVTQYALDAWA